MLGIIQGRFSAFLILGLSIVLAYVYMYLANQGRKVSIRKFPAVAALSEAVGRAAEMGKPIYFSTGSLQGGSITDPTQGPQFIAGISILSYVTKLCVQNGVRLDYFTSVPDTLPLAIDSIKTAYISEGHEEEFDMSIINFNSGQSPNLTASLGYMQRERPASNIYMGGFQYETVVLGAAGNSIGAVQIAGTANASQIPFFVATCDYMLITEELFAASAEISGDPSSLGLIQVEDILKLFIIVTMTLGVLFSMAGSKIIINLLGM